MNDMLDITDLSEMTELSDTPKESSSLTDEDANDDVISIEETTQADFEDSSPAEENENAESDNSNDEIAMLHASIEALRKELDERNAAFERMSREIGEFSELYPDKNVNSLPDSVWESVRSGIPLAAAYALYEKKTALRAEAAKNTNEKNSLSSTGAVGKGGSVGAFSPDEVRAMSREEVRKNYSKIIESMKTWN